MRTPPIRPEAPHPLDALVDHWARPLLTGHRGAAAYARENSLTSFMLALDMGADVLECDVRMTRDGALVLAHDGIVGRGRNVARIAWETAAFLQARVPDLLALDALLDLAAARGALLNVDLKAPGAETPLVAALAARDMLARTVVTSRAPYQLRRLRALAPGLRLGLSKGSSPPAGLHGGPEWAALLGERAIFPYTLPGILRRAHADAAYLQWRLVTPTLVAALHAAGLGIYAWTVDSAADARRLIAWGIDGITTNCPDRIRPAIAVTSHGHYATEPHAELRRNTR